MNDKLKIKPLVTFMTQYKNNITLYFLMFIKLIIKE